MIDMERRYGGLQMEYDMSVSQQILTYTAQCLTMVCQEVADSSALLIWQDQFHGECWCAAGYKK